MKKRLALLIYPEFSLQEIANLLRLFRWKYDTVTDIIYTEKTVVKSEEVIPVMNFHQKTMIAYFYLVVVIYEWHFVIRN